MKISQPKQWEKDREMSMNSQPELKLSTRTEQLASSRDAAMQKFLDGMTLIAEASAICGFSLFNSKIMAPNAFGLPASLAASIEEGTVRHGTIFLKKRVLTDSGITTSGRSSVSLSGTLRQLRR
ncbi:hypothetical protein [Escherichia coli]|uniref:hypothetical protein n=1 Tax=Escherichia coli TaxID=562 RepID=UPI00201AB3B6|nr:hypothetical protein [Escherichia coli]